MDEKLQFVGRRLGCEQMAELCREFGISRKTGYKIFERYRECGVQGLTDRSGRPYRYAHQLPFQVENYILNVKREHPSWGARKNRRAPGAEILWKQRSALFCPANYDNRACGYLNWLLADRDSGMRSHDGEK